MLSQFQNPSLFEYADPPSPSLPPPPQIQIDVRDM